MKTVSLPFDVILGRKAIDTVFYSMSKADGTKADMEESVKRSLVDHDGYDQSIKVRLAARLTRDDYDVEANYGE